MSPKKPGMTNGVRNVILYSLLNSHERNIQATQIRKYGRYEMILEDYKDADWRAVDFPVDVE